MKDIFCNLMLACEPAPTKMLGGKYQSDPQGMRSIEQNCRVNQMAKVLAFKLAVLPPVLGPVMMTARRWDLMLRSMGIGGDRCSFSSPSSSCWQHKMHHEI